jgi:hypothetical protein
MDVKEYHIRRSFQNPLYCRNPISAFANNLHVLELTQPVNDATTSQRLVVND